MKNLKNIILILLVLIVSQGLTISRTLINDLNKEIKMNNKDTATFGAGCFWCVESIFESLNGVEEVISGFSGGKSSNPTYNEVCKEDTGHAEVCQIIYDSDKINFTELLEVFWKIHDPTTLNRQGADIGTQYRSVVFYHNDEQKQLAMAYMKKLDDAKIWTNPIVTEISQYMEFFKAEDRHQDYYSQNKNEPYCRMVITPKVEKFKKIFSHKLTP